MPEERARIIGYMDANGRIHIDQTGSFQDRLELAKAILRPLAIQAVTEMAGNQPKN